MAGHAQTGERVHLFDGREGHRVLRRDEWADDLLPRALDASWDDAGRLARVIDLALEEGLAERVLDAAQRLAEIDPERERGVGKLASVLVRLP